MQRSSAAAFELLDFNAFLNESADIIKATLLTPHCAVKLYVVVLGDWMFCQCQSFQMTDPVVCLVLLFYYQSGSPQKNFKEYVLLKADMQCIPPHGKNHWGNNHAQTNQHGLLPTAQTLFYHVSRIPSQENRKQYSSRFPVYAAGSDWSRTAWG